MNTLTVSRKLVSAGLVLILVTGLIHLIEAPENYEEAAYKGSLFYLNAAGALVAAVGIYRGARSWGWGLGILVAGGAFVMYVISRTVGLPGLDVDEWLEPIGVVSLIVEGLFVLLALSVLASRPIPVGASRERAPDHDTARSQS